MDLVATAVLIQRQVGGDLAGVLDNIASTIRERQRMKAQVRTLTAQGRLSGIVIAMLPFGLFGMFSVINPSYVRLLWTEPLGLMMLAMGIVSQVIGMVVISRIIRIDV
jgi:tight adherence protein B